MKATIEALIQTIQNAPDEIYNDSCQGNIQTALIMRTQTLEQSAITLLKQMNMFQELF